LDTAGTGKTDCSPAAGCRSKGFAVVEETVADTVVLERHMFGDTGEAGCMGKARERHLAPAEK
jgi:hypothetical protein